MELTDKQWIKIEPVILESMRKKDSRGRKPRDPREVLNGILWILLGSRISGGWLSDMNVMRIISRLFCCLLVLLFSYVYFEIGSR
jgi:hypothetical protein